VYSLRVLNSRKEAFLNLLLVLSVQEVLGHHPDHGVQAQHVPFELSEEVAEEVEEAVAAVAKVEGLSLLTVEWARFFRIGGS
jgi:hypothetical protein